MTVSRLLQLRMFQTQLLLTGDGPLRQFASKQSVRVHGVLWAIDEIHKFSALPPQALFRALAIFEDDRRSGCQPLSIHADFGDSRDLAKRTSVDGYAVGSSLSRC